jgi:hypothetical protein
VYGTIFIMSTEYIFTKSPFSLSVSGYEDNLYLEPKQFWELHRETGYHRYGFIHINKCAGTSIIEYLGGPKCHYKVDEAIREIGMEQWKSYYTFTAVRNPYDRMISMYQYRIKYIWFFGDKMKKDRPCINEWIYKVLVERDKDLIHSNFDPWFSPALDWITYEGEICVDKVTKVEHIDKDWKEICEGIGCKYYPLPRKNYTCRDAAIQTFSELSSESVTILNEHFAKDFEAFDYKIKKV